ncbi:energy-coupling factor transport system substrate-specific component [Acetitomaculum ruminis DSM 5522]|uniref:Energy-coupling factor transport system substrate-specific component n=1 Tax=Acetitomaculum ruminis DSM 5522 TaxID=1120918 RepID=A0A1I0XB46_9FIRM|nr:MptD family putative ECF transporter S component [Acetitomaculum ruminis]SFA97143.1 energy-coupling factor transport system substrate-specific component [Acetitomaculum ruminis DSM 5522]
MENNNRLSAKDLINTGIYTAIYAVVMFAFTIVTSFAPITYVLLPAFLAIICAPIYMLFITKVKTFGMITIMGILIGILMMFVTGNSWIMFVFCALLGLISDLITKAGGYSSKSMASFGYYIFSFWPISSFFQIWFMRDKYFDTVVASMGQNYADGLKAITPYWIIPVMFIYTFVAAIIGGLIAGKINKKHFAKAGIA